MYGIHNRCYSGILEFLDLGRLTVDGNFRSWTLQVRGGMVVLCSLDLTEGLRVGRHVSNMFEQVARDMVVFAKFAFCRFDLWPSGFFLGYGCLDRLMDFRGCSC